MPVGERERLALYEQLNETIGPNHAGTLMEYLPPMRWDELATKDDVILTARELRSEMAELRTELRGEMAELRTELRGEMAELRTELRGEMAELRGEMQAGFAAIEVRFAQQTRTMMWTMACFALTVWVALLVAGIG